MYRPIRIGGAHGQTCAQLFIVLSSARFFAICLW